MYDLSTSEKEEKIVNDTYTISFCKKTKGNENHLKEEIDKTGALFYETRKESEWKKILAKMVKNMQDKTIIKIRIAGETAYFNHYIKELPLSKELFSEILDCIDFNRQILIVENTTCFSAGYLMPSNKLLQENGGYSVYDPSPIDDDDKIVNLCKKKLQNDRQCFYYGATDPVYANVDEIYFIQKHSSSTDFERIALKIVPTHLDTKAKQKYINCLYNDILSLDAKKHPRPTMNDIKCGMGNNMFGDEQQYIKNQNRDNLNTSSLSNNADVFCSLTNCTCCGYKLC
ncbi:MAG: hypothetical protein II669_02910 [Elusimicrobia bacterium]|nr:hypothetical protein [Elusimicrobiota bacterium]